MALPHALLTVMENVFIPGRSTAEASKRRVCGLKENVGSGVPFCLKTMFSAPPISVNCADKLYADTVVCVGFDERKEAVGC